MNKERPNSRFPYGLFQGRDHARAAVEAYLAAAARDISGIDESLRLGAELRLVKGLAGALELARRTRQEDLAQAALTPPGLPPFLASGEARTVVGAVLNSSAGAVPD